MKRIGLILCVLLVFSVFSGCRSDLGETSQVESSQTVADGPEEISADVINQLKAYPDSYQETCKRTDLVIMDQDGEVLNENLWNDFYEKVQNGESAEIMVAYFTTEGDPILNYVRYDGASFYHVNDHSRDMYGAEPHYVAKTFSYLQSFMDVQTEMFVLSNAPLADLDAYEEYCQTQPEPYPETLLYIIHDSGN